MGLAGQGSKLKNPDSAHESVPRGDAPQPVFVAAMLFVAGGHSVAEPLVQARIAGRQVLLAVDTGARLTVLDPSLAAPAASESGGKPSNWASHLAIEFGGARVVLQTVALEPMDRSLTQDQGIYGFLSPQDLARSFAVMIDFPGRRLFAFRSANDMQAWLKQMGMMKQTMAVDVRNRDGKLEISATAGKGPPVWLELDTAEPDTMLPAGYSVGKIRKKDREILGHETEFRRVKISLGGGLDATETAYEPTDTPAGGIPGRLSPHLGVNFLRHFIIGIPGSSPKAIWMTGGK